VLNEEIRLTGPRSRRIQIHIETRRHKNVGKSPLEFAPARHSVAIRKQMAKLLVIVHHNLRFLISPGIT
jgi:hypothetical protein